MGQAAPGVGFCEYGCSGTLQLGAQTMNRPAWDIPNLVTLWLEHAVRGENRTLPGAPGVRGYPTRLDQSEHDLALFITGEVTYLGVAATDVWETFQQNLDVLWATVFAPVTTGRGTLDAILTMPDGSTRTADVQVSPLRLANPEDIDPSFVEATFTMTVVSGRFA